MTQRFHLAGGALLGMALGSVPAFAFECASAPPAVLSLDYDSRYTDDDDTRSKIDEAANAEVNASQKPVDDFIRDLAALVNQVSQAEGLRTEIADCVVAQVADWARSGALLDLRSDTARLTFGSRLAGIALALRQVHNRGGTAQDWAAVRTWLRQLSDAQLTFWEQKAPPGARQGNLRAWAALGIAASADLLNDPVMRGWAAWSVQYVLCTAGPDGSLPQEMRRGRLALHYQLHAVAPLVVSSRILADHGLPVRSACNEALTRVVDFTLSDIADGARTKAITGETQSFFDGSASLSAYHLAWLEAWLSLAPDAQHAQQMAQSYRPLASSKLGGAQAGLWH